MAEQVVEFHEAEIVDIIKRIALDARGNDYEAAADHLRELADLRIGWTPESARCFERAIDDLMNEIGPTEEGDVHASSEQCVREPEECHS